MFEQNIQSIKDVDERLQQSDYEQAFGLLAPDTDLICERGT